MKITNHTTATSGQVSLTVRELFEMFVALGAADLPLVDLNFQDIEQILSTLTESAAPVAQNMNMTIKVPVSISVLQGLPVPAKQQVLVPFLLALRSGDLSALPVPAPPTAPVPPTVTSPGQDSAPTAPASPGKVLMFAAKTPPAQVCQTS